MRGFLHRIAASALRPQSRIHPVVGSVFAMPKREPPPEPLAGVEHASELPAAAPPSATLVHREASIAERVTLSPGTPPDPSLRVTRPSEPAPLPSVRPFQPLVQQMPEIPASRSFETAATPVRKQPTSQPHAANEDHAGAPELQITQLEAREERQHRTAPEPTPAPRAPVEQRPAPAPESTSSILSAELALSLREMVQHTRPAPSPRSARGSGAQLARVFPAPREPDDIQIHIGRIEVTALPPPAPRPPTSPVRKGPSLDEYLSRRNGRG